MEKNLIASASTTVDTTVDKAWDALIDPAAIKQYMFGTNVASDWKEGSPITWKGEWKGKPYEDKGVVLQVKPKRSLRYSHFSPLSGVPDQPENYHTVMIELVPEGKRVRILLTQDNNATEEARQHSEENWKSMLAELKKLVERDAD